MLPPTVIAIPIFALLIAFEAWLIKRENRENFDRKDVWTNIFLGFGSVVWGAFFGLATGFFYLTAYEYAPYKMPTNAWWAWAILLFVDDFAYYWFHRFSHEIRFLWNFHVVHHSSNKYNLSVAVRQSWFSGVAHWVFYVPIAFLGFPFWAFVTMHGLNLIYQFWIHTEKVKRLGFLEFILNTPSHHRVHHGVNNPYLDKNYAGIFIVWDRMFGTFVSETETPRYGIIKPLNSYNMLWINTHGWAEMFEAIKNKKTFYGKLRCIFGAPAMEFEETDLSAANIKKQI
ncbi:MAG TPA: sterol desaturase family protein [Pyrinomonadaceae bacterium]|nr:sterol desaturase family protein [Pyrinomonadaceae bacterium]